MFDSFINWFSILIQCAAKRAVASNMPINTHHTPTSEVV